MALVSVFAVNTGEQLFVREAVLDHLELGKAFSLTKPEENPVAAKSATKTMKKEEVA